MNFGTEIDETRDKLKQFFLQKKVITYHSRFIPKGVAEVFQMFHMITANFTKNL
jgi:hypothetical protein